MKITTTTLSLCLFASVCLAQLNPTRGMKQFINTGTGTNLFLHNTALDGTVAGEAQGLTNVPSAVLGKSVNIARVAAKLNMTLQQSNTFTIQAFGDSMSQYGQCAADVFVETLGANWGISQAGFPNGDPWFNQSYLTNQSVNVTWIPQPDTNFWTDYPQLAAGSEITWGEYYAGNALTTCRAFEIFYEKWPSGGTVQIQRDTGSGFSTVTTLDTYADTPSIASVIINSYDGTLVWPARLRFHGVSGLNNIMWPNPIYGLPNKNKIRYLTSGQGGMGLNVILTCSNTISSAFQVYKPDMLLFSMRHDYTVTYDLIDYLVKTLTNAVPWAEPVFLGGVETPGAPDTKDMNQRLHDYCVTNGWCFIDLQHLTPGTNEMARNNIFWIPEHPGWETSPHVTRDGYKMMLKPVLDAFGWDGLTMNARKQFSGISVGTSTLPDPTIPFVVGGQRSGGSYSLVPQDNNVGLFEKANGFTTRFIDGQNQWLQAHDNGWIALSSGSDYYNNFTAAATPSKSFYVGHVGGDTGYGPVNSGAGTLLVENAIATQHGPITNNGCVWVTAGSAATGTYPVGSLWSDTSAGTLAIFRGGSWHTVTAP